MTETAAGDHEPGAGESPVWQALCEPYLALPRDQQRAFLNWVPELASLRERLHDPAWLRQLLARAQDGGQAPAPEPAAAGEPHRHAWVADPRKRRHQVHRARVRAGAGQGGGDGMTGQPALPGDELERPREEALEETKRAVAGALWAQFRDIYNSLAADRDSLAAEVAQLLR